MARDSEEAVNDPLSPGGAYRQELRAVQVECDIPDDSLSPPRFEARGDERDVASAFSPSSSPERGTLSEEERKWRRMTYPAGRIYHLVPARLVFGASCKYWCQECFRFKDAEIRTTLDLQVRGVIESSSMKPRAAKALQTAGVRRVALLGAPTPTEPCTRGSQDTNGRPKAG